MNPSTTEKKEKDFYLKIEIDSSGLISIISSVDGKFEKLYTDVIRAFMNSYWNETKSD